MRSRLALLALTLAALGCGALGCGVAFEAGSSSGGAQGPQGGGDPTSGSSSSSSSAGGAGTSAGGAGGTGGAGGIAGGPGTAGTDNPGGGDPVGCSDGTREGFADLAAHPDIASCSGGFDVPGVAAVEPPACNRQAGNDSANPAGTGCNVEDLCAAGWHVCVNQNEVGAKSPTGCNDAVDGGSRFFATRQSGPGGNQCTASGANDVFGCGNVGSQTLDATTCAPLNRYTADLCVGVPSPWQCGADSSAEAANISKPGAASGGVLCCRDG